jgi:glycosyltransferase involved in cell wall biosynthesis
MNERFADEVKLVNTIGRLKWGTSVSEDSGKGNESRSLRVLLAAPIPPPDHGGIANWTRIVRKEFQERPDVELSFLDTSVRWRSAVNHSLPVRLAGGSLQALRDVLRAARQTSRGSVDVFHLCSSGGLAAAKDLLMLRAARASGVPAVIHYRMGRLPTVAKLGGLEWTLLRAAMRLADLVIVLDRKSEDCVSCAIPEARVVRLPNLVEIDAVDRLRKQRHVGGRPEGVTRITYVGQVLPAKGLRELVSACSRLADGQLRLEVLGPVAARFQEELTRLGGPSRGPEWLHFHGAVEHDDAIMHLAASDIFVLPSYTEGFPNVILEAMACERPILATSVGAIPESQIHLSRIRRLR